LFRYEDLEPKNVFKFFGEIAKIPHGSGNTKMLSDYLCNFARIRNLKYFQDDLNNVIIIKEAGKGFENSDPVILQGHMDMVCVKTPECNKDLSKDGLDLETDGKYIYAKGTSLGADDGIAVAYILAILDEDFACPKIEAIFTVDEETGMYGIKGLDVSMLTAKRLICLDSDIEGVLFAGCTGCLKANCSIKLSYCESNKKAFKITLDGLKGGHSGVEIDKYRANANKVMGRILESLSHINLVYIDGGKIHNVIPPIATAVVVADKIDIEPIYKILKEEFIINDPDLTITVKEVENSLPVLDKQTTEKIIHLLMTLPTGVQSMYTGEMSSVVKTSVNMGVLEFGKDRFTLGMSIRSSVDSEKIYIFKQLKLITESIGGTFEFINDYPAWKFNPKSEIRNHVSKVYEELFGEKPVIEVMHAGVECGIFTSKIKGLDCVSFGPEMIDIHSPKEKLDIASTERTWKLLRKVLKTLWTF